MRTSLSAGMGSIGFSFACAFDIERNAAAPTLNSCLIDSGFKLVCVYCLFTGFLFMRLVRPIFDDVPGLAFQFAADGLQRREPDGLGLAVLEDREIGGSDVHTFRHLAQR